MPASAQMERIAYIMKRNYPWIVCFAGMLVIFCTTGFCNNLLSVYLPYIQASGISSAQGSLLFTIRSGASLVAMLIIDRYYDKLTLRKGLAGGLLFTILATVFYGIGGSALVYDIGAVLSGFGFCLAGFVPITLLINNWFKTRKGLALGICAMGSGVATIFFPPVVTSIAENHGVRAAFFFQTIILIIVSVVVILFIRNTPEEIQAAAYEKGEAASKTSGGYDTMKPVDWIPTALVILCMGGGIGGALAHMTIVFTTSAYPAATAALMISLCGICQTVGKLIYGGLCDRIGVMITSAIWMLMSAGGMFCAIFLNGTSLAPCLLMVILFGLGFAPALSGISLWAHDIVDGPRYTTVMKWMQILYSIGTMIFSGFPGWIYGKTGEYRSSFVGMGVLMLISVGSLIVLYRMNIRRRTQKIDETNHDTNC